MIQVGKVSTADVETGVVRVTFPDRDDAVSSDLPVLASGGWARGNGMPAPGDMVLCVFLDNSQSAGFCLGSYYGKTDTAPGNSDQRGVWFEDGSYVYYDRSSNSLRVKAAGGVRIEGDLTVTGSVHEGGG